MIRVGKLGTAEPQPNRKRMHHRGTETQRKKRNQKEHERQEEGRIPKGFHNTAQGREATLGRRFLNIQMNSERVP
jgi:hypothetical protein